MPPSTEPVDAPAAKTHRLPLPAGIWVMGVASLCMDMSSELIHALLPLFMVTTLGASMASIGVIEGIAEAVAALMRVFSGALSDRLRQRKWLMVTGYALSALSKPLFPLANSVLWVLTARSVDRLGKGIRGAPRDALIADITPEHQRGQAFGLRQALDSVGAFLGPTSAIALLWFFSSDITTAMWMAVVPAAIAVLVLILFVHEPSACRAPHHRAPALRLATARQLGKPFWQVIAIACLFTLARCSDAFLILRAHDIGIGTMQVPAVMVLMNVVYASLAYPFGKVADRLAARTLLCAGLLVLIPAHVALAMAHDWLLIALATVLWGAHMALTQGLFAKMITDVTPPALRGSAFGVFGLTSAVAALCASSIAGVLWHAAGAGVTFFSCASFATMALVFLRIVRW